MKKFKISISFIVLIVFCIFLHNFLLLLNYFFALAIHELAHFFVASSKGYNLKKIKLDIFGMSIDLDTFVDDKDNFSINMAGPLCNIFVSILCLATYWLFPKSFEVLNTFCLANLTLAIFNLLPIYPLDGGKIFAGFFNDKKLFRKANIIIKIVLMIVCLIFIFINFLSNRPMFVLLFIFLLTNKTEPTPSFVFIKHMCKKSFQKIELIKINSSLNLYSILKLIKPKKYTIFYCEDLEKRYFNQDDLIEMSLKYPLSSRIINCKF